MTGVQQPRGAGSRLARSALLACVGSLAVAGPALASDVEVFPDQLQIDGDPDNDAITLSTNGVEFTVTDTGTGGVTTTDPDCTPVHPFRVTCPASFPGEAPIRSFFVDLDDGVDSFTNQNFATIGAFISAFDGAGAKTIVAGPGAQFIQGGVDNDTIDGGEGDDLMIGGVGDDDPTGGADLLMGGPGADSVDYFRDAPVSITLDGVANDGEAGEADNVQVENVVAGNGADSLIGDSSPNLLVGGGGGDLIRGGDGNDELFGDFSGGGQVARGGGAPAGGDVLDGGAGRDLYDCGRGFDLALREPLDTVRTNCERIGADVVGDSVNARGKKHDKLRIRISCPASELKACSGTLKLTADGKRIGKGDFSVANGETKRAKAKLSKKGRKALRKAKGKLLATVEATTNEPGGVAVDAETLFIHR